MLRNYLAVSPTLSANCHRAFGVEQEHFVFSANKLPPTHDQINRLWEGLLTDGYRVRASSPEGTVLSVERDTDDGLLVITNDSCTHIIETAFPKFQCLTRFRDLYNRTWQSLQARLNSQGLAIKFGGAIRKAPNTIYWRQKETDSRGERLKSFLSRNPIRHPLFCQAFPACFAATHVSLDMPAEEAVTKLPYFYANEYKIPLGFSTSTQFQGIRARCVRLLAWIANFHQPYPLLGIPDPIPSTFSDYEALRSQCSGRDYSFVAIRHGNRLEFRSACSQNTVEDVERLVRHRLEVDWNAISVDPLSQSGLRLQFDHACQSGVGKDLVSRLPARTKIRGY